MEIDVCIIGRFTPTFPFKLLPVVSGIIEANAKYIIPALEFIGSIGQIIATPSPWGP